MNLREKSELANIILEEETPYLDDKNRIHGFFNKNLDKLSKEIIESQLTIIDSYYSTNMSRRYYGIEEITESILGISNSKKILKDKFIEYSKQPNVLSELTTLFNGKFGYSKKGEKFGRAISLISKYAYFITDFNFPIYDSIVREAYPLITGRKLKDNKIEDFIISMKELLQSTYIENFNKLDNLLWLIGKINRGNYSLILKKGNFLKLVKIIGDFDSLKSTEIDNKIGIYIIKNIDSLFNIFTDRQIEMIKFSNELKNKNRIKVRD